MTKKRLGAVLAAVMGCLLVVGNASAVAPSVVTGPVTASAQTSATVTGSVNPNGLATTWFFQYGTSTNYGSQTGSSNAGSGTTSTNVSASLTGLSPGTTYHYRLVAMNSSGTTQGADAVLTTGGAPAPAAVTGAASGISPTGATLNGSVNPNGRPTTWQFEYGTSTNYGSTTASQNAGSGTTAVNVSSPVSGLTAGRTYHFRLVATSDGGTSRGSDQTFTPASAPTVTTNPASSVSTPSARLNGRVNPNGQSTSWHFEYGTSTSYGSATATQNAGSGTSTSSVSVTVLGLAAGTTYHFRLVATNASGTSAGGDQAFTTGGAPAATTGPAQNVGTSSATLTGSVDPRNHSTSWYFEYGPNTRYGTHTGTQSVSAGSGNRGVSVGISGLAPGTTYHYRLVATSSAGTSRGADVAFTTTANTVTLTTSSYKVVYRHFLRLSGNVSSGQAGVNVTILAQRFGDSAFASVATVQSGSGGGWTYLAQPTIRTTYEATANGVTSAPITIGVRPSVSLRKTTGARLSTHVVAGTSLAGRFVQLQRLSGTRWVTVKRSRLNGSSTAFFRAALLPHGRSTIRIALSVNQAGPGYLAGFSRQLVYRRS
jgi:phosphodiesterase/alkaline phosphatase D-like protein